MSYIYLQLHIDIIYYINITILISNQYPPDHERTHQYLLHFTAWQFLVCLFIYRRHYDDGLRAVYLARVQGPVGLWWPLHWVSYEMFEKIMALALRGQGRDD